MAISYPLTPPTSGIARITIGMANVVGVSRSPWTGSQQVYQHQGQWWRADITLPRMARAAMEEWVGFIAALGGRYGTFLLGDPGATSPRGAVTGSPVVDGASQTGLTLDVRSLPVSTTGVFLAGDMIQIGTGSSSRLYKIVQDANSDGSGDATLEIWPRLRESPADGAAIDYTSPVGLFRLENDLNAFTWEPPVIGSMTFSAIEAI